MRLKAPQLKSLNAFLLELYAEPPEGLHLERIVDRLTHLIPATWFSADEVYPGTTRIEHRVGRNLEAVANGAEGVRLYGNQNPSVAYLQQVAFAPALRISDFTTFRQFRETDFYRLVLSQLTGFRDQAALMVRMPEYFVGFTFNRDSNFTDEEHLILEMVQPHLERVLSRSVQYTQLPANPPLTAREREVLHWLAEGKRDSEIGVILRISHRTVEQHVRAIMQKLAVESRGAATAAAWRARMATPAIPGPSNGSGANSAKG